MQKLLFALFLILGTLISFGQDDQVDSLKLVLSQDQADSSRVLTLVELSSQYYRTDTEEARRLATEAKDLAEKSSYTIGLAQAHKALGMSHYFEGDAVNTLVEWELALEEFELADDLNGVSNILNNLGAVHFNGGNDEAALEYYLQSIKVAESINDTIRTVTALMNIGTIYLTKDRELALSYYRRALPITEAIRDYDAIGTLAINLGEIFLADDKHPDSKLLNLDSALFYFEMALDAYGGSSTYSISNALQSIGKVYSLQEDFDKAIQIQTEAYQVALARDAPLDMVLALTSLADTYDSMGDDVKAIVSYNQAKDIAVEIDAPYETQSVYLGLAKAYSKVSDFKQAYEHQELFNTIRDTLYNAEMDQALESKTLSYEIEKKQGQISLLEKDKELKAVELKRQKAIRNGSIAFGILLLVLAGGLFNKYKYTKRTNKVISREKERSDELLLNILPAEVAEELKDKGSAEAVQIDQVSVLFTDFKGFTALSEKLTPKELVRDLHECFSAFDLICETHGLEKIKTIGDAYMAAGGLPVPNNTHPTDAIAAALEMRDFVDEGKLKKTAAGLPFFEIRIGIHTGPVVAGIVGVKKFSYDIWGDTVNTASRMESSGEPGKVNMSEATYALVKDTPNLTFTSRGKIQAKGKGEMEMYFVEPEEILS